ncbi:glycogen-binding domain-containing protein [bacterium]|nr:glycogen-binding domain-containing protein [candidate division CSSED10-310 bacterium]
MTKKVENNSLKPKRVTFRINAKPGSRVFVAGDFNQWDAENKQLKDSKGNGTFSGCLTLEPGTYEYKFVIDGTWTIDPACTEHAKNACGSLNSVLRVK